MPTGCCDHRLAQPVDGAVQRVDEFASVTHLHEQDRQQDAHGAKVGVGDTHVQSRDASPGSDDNAAHPDGLDMGSTDIPFMSQLGVDGGL